MDNTLALRLRAFVKKENLMISHIDTHLYLSGSYALQRVKDVQKLGIKGIVRVDGLNRDEGHWSNDFNVLDMPFSDGEPIPEGYLPRATAFIDRHLASGQGVLVHCHMGISRSVTVVMAYLIEYQGLTLPEAFHHVLTRRPIAHPHPFLTASLVEQYGLPYDIPQVMHERFLHNLIKTLHARSAG